MLEPSPTRTRRPSPPALCGKVTLRGGLCKRPLESCSANHHPFELKMQDTAHYAVYCKAVATYKLRNAETCDPVLADAMWSTWHPTNNSKCGVFTLVLECENYDIVEVPRAISVHDVKIPVKHRSLFPQWALFAVDPLCTRPKINYPKQQHQNYDDIDRCNGDARFDILESDGHCFELPPPRRERKKRKRWRGWKRR